MEYKEWHYPQLEIDLDKLEDNLRALKSRMDASGIRLAGVVKGFNGLPWAARIYERVGYSSIASSRLEQLHHLRMNGIAVPLMLIRIPMMSEVEETARWTDISLHSEPEVLRAMERAVKAAAGKRRHKVILMVDLGDLRRASGTRTSWCRPPWRWSGRCPTWNWPEWAPIWAATARSRPPRRR